MLREGDVFRVSSFRNSLLRVNQLGFFDISNQDPDVKMLPGEKDALMAGGRLTVKVSDAVPLLPKAEVRSPEVLRYEPGAVPVTSTLRVQVAPAATSPPV